MARSRRGETVEQAQARELYEETGLSTYRAVQIYVAETCVKNAPAASHKKVMLAVLSIGIHARIKNTESLLFCWFKDDTASSVSE